MFSSLSSDPDRASLGNHLYSVGLLQFHGDVKDCAIGMPHLVRHSNDRSSVTCAGAAVARLAAISVH
jgi:hypothetical protein